MLTSVRLVLNLDGCKMGDVLDFGGNNTNAVQSWRTRWRHYIKTAERNSSSARITAENFIKLGGISKGSSILDLGCGHGRITELLVEKVPLLDIVGIDATRGMLDNFLVKSGANRSKIRLVCADVTRLPFDVGTFDAVVSSRVFQYLADPVLGVREALRVLKPGGFLVISIPNKLNPVKYLGYKGKLYSPFEVRAWFEACGLKDIKHGSMCFFPSSKRWKALASSLEVGEEIPFIKYFGGNVVVKGRKEIQPVPEISPTNPTQATALGSVCKAGSARGRR